MPPSTRTLTLSEFRTHLTNLLEADALFVAATLKGQDGINITDPNGSALVHPVRIKEQKYFQFAYHNFQKVTHRNLPLFEAVEHLIELLRTSNGRLNIRTTQSDEQVVLLPEGHVRLTTRPTNRRPSPLTHNRVKNYILQEGQYLPFLHALGIMTQSGQVVSSRYDKFRQINRFLEIVHDIIEHLPKQGPLHIVDFGAGKAYLSFALYHYFHSVLGREVHLYGIEQKPDLVAFCQQLAEKLQWPGLSFVCSSIESFELDTPIDLAVSLHACDTATDDAIAKAVRWNAKVILAAPCCQKELYRQLNAEELQPMLRYGVIRERLTGLVTDTLRAARLEAAGYAVQILEFIETEHTPKNLLIRAIRSPHINRKNAIQSYQQLRDFWHVIPRIEKNLPLPDRPPLEMTAP